MTENKISKLENQLNYFYSKFKNDPKLKEFFRFIDYLSIKNIYKFNFLNGITYEEIGNIKYEAKPAEFLHFSSQNKYDNIIYQYFNLEYSDCDIRNKSFNRNNIIPFAFDENGRDAFYISCYPESYGQILFHEGDCNWDLTFKSGTWIISKNFTEFIEKIISQNKDYKDIEFLQDAYMNITKQ